MSVNFHTHSTTNKLLLFLVVPLVFYILKLLSFIFIPLVAALLIALMFLPVLRWLTKKNVNKTISTIIVISIISIFVFIVFTALKISIKEVLTADVHFWHEIVANINTVLIPVLKILGIDQVAGQDSISTFIHSSTFTDTVSKNFGRAFGILNESITMFLMAVFFLILLLAGSINVQKVMENTIFKQRIPSMKTFVILEKSIVKFIVVKTLISLTTGVTFGVICLIFKIPFPVFWGLMAFLFHFIQLVGSLFVTVLLSVFAIAQIDHTGTLVLFIALLIGVQILYGSVLEPILMGKTFSINTITILVMLMLWGYLWGIPGMVLAVPITVAIKTILEQVPKTKIIAQIMS